MKSAVETLNPTRVKLTVEVPFADLEPGMKSAYQRIASQINVPGFRKGKVPPQIIDSRIGRETVLTEAINDLLPNLYMRALEENELRPLGQPEIDLTKFADQEPLEFTAEVDIIPEITLPSLEGISVEVDEAVASEEDVDTEIETLRERFATQKEVERAAADGDIVSIDLVATKDGEVVEGGEVYGHTYKVGSGQLVEGIDEAIRGLSAGEEKTFVSSLEAGELAGQDVDIKVTVHSVKEQELPELDDDFAQLASEFDTVAELKDDLREQLLRQARLNQAAQARDAVLEHLLDATEIPLPEAMVEDQINSRRAQLEQQLSYIGRGLQDYLDEQGQTIDEFEGELEKGVRDMIASQFLLDKISRERDIQVEQDELTQFLLARAQESGESPEAFMQHMIDHNHIPEMIGEVGRGKALAQIVADSTVTDTAGNVVEIRNLKSDGTIGEPEAEDEASAATEAASAADTESPKSPESTETTETAKAAEK